MVVDVRFEGDDDIETFLIGSREESVTAAVQVYSAASPLGKALSGAREGDTVAYETPNGKTMKPRGSRPDDRAPVGPGPAGSPASRTP